MKMSQEMIDRIMIDIANTKNNTIKKALVSDVLKSVDIIRIPSQLDITVCIEYISNEAWKEYFCGFILVNGYKYKEAIIIDNDTGEYITGEAGIIVGRLLTALV